MRSGRRSGKLMRLLFRAPLYLYHWKVGWVFGHRFVALVHVGRRTGRRHETVLEVLRFNRERDEVVVMSGFGRDADWFRNLHANGYAEITVARRHFRAECRDVGEDEACDSLADYERRNRLATPIVRYVLSRLLGWRYDGSEAARRCAVVQLPLVAFSPAQDFT